MSFVLLNFHVSFFKFNQIIIRVNVQENDGQSSTAIAIKDVIM